MIKGVILDFDDTLCLTQKASFELQNIVLEKMGRAKMDMAVHLKTWGMVLSESMPIRSPGVDYEEFKKLYDEAVQKYATTGKLDVVPKENLDTLEKILKQGRYVAIVTSRTANEVKHLLESKHPLSRLVKDIYHRDNSEYLKPNPKVFDMLLLEHGLQPKECVYVGDSLSDAEATVNAGINFVASLESELKDRSDFEPYNIKHFIDKFPELLQILKILDLLPISSPP